MRMAISGRVPVSGRISATGRVSNRANQGFPFTLIGNGLQAFYRMDAGNVTTIAGKVSALADLSGNGHTLTQSSPTRRPVWSINTLNGNNSLTFSGGQNLRGSSLIQTSVRPFTMCAVQKSTNNSGTGRCFFAPTAGFGGHAFGSNMQGTGEREVRANGVANLPDSAATINTEVWIATGEVSSPTLTLHKLYLGSAGTPTTLTPAASATTNPSGSASSIGSILVAGTFQWIGEIYEILFLNRLFSDQERTDYLSYVTTKYGTL